jgi:sterol 14alpha-demethylase
VNRLPTPPPVAGLPALGNLWEYIRHPEPLLDRGYRELGPIFSLRLGPRRAAVLIGPDYHRFFFQETDSCLSVAATFQWLRPIFGDRFPLTLEGRAHLTDRRILQRPLKGQLLAGYASFFVERTKRWLDSLNDRGEFELVEAIRRLTLLNAADVFLGGATCDRIGEEEIINLLDEVAREAPDHLLRRFRMYLPRAGRFRARRRLHLTMQQVIGERRSNGSRHDDYLQALMETAMESGLFSDTDIKNLATGMVWGGHATLWGHLSWALILLLQHPDYLEAVMQEQWDVFGPRGDMQTDRLKRLHHLDWALRETERMRPPVIVIGRLTVRAYEVDGYCVPPGWLTFISPPIAHRLPEVFSNPDSYDPFRFAPGRQEDQRPYSLIGFGKGTHRCIGEDLAMLEMKVVLSMLLQRFHLRLEHPGPQRKPGPDPNRPQGPVTIRFERR